MAIGKTTPGPWGGWHGEALRAYSMHNHPTRWEAVIYADGVLVGQGIGANIEESEANARLIAAAPELLEVAKTAMHDAYQSAHSQGDPDDERVMTTDAILYRMARAAIAKAEGE